MATVASSDSSAQVTTDQAEEDCRRCHLAFSALCTVVCIPCKLSFSTAQEFDEHFILVNHQEQLVGNDEGDGSYSVCPHLCNKSFEILPQHKRHKMLQEHVRIVHEALPSISISPDTSAVKNAEIEDGSLIKGIFSCSLCNKAFDTAQSLTSHVKEVHVKEEEDEQNWENVLKKNIYDDALKVDKDLDQADDAEHKLRVKRKSKSSPSSKYSCEGCGKTFRTKRQMSNHGKICTLIQKDDGDCTYCDIHFSYPEDFRYHLLMEHKEKQNHHICFICEKIFFLENQLHDHFSVIHKDCHVKCSKCHLPLKDQREFQKHELECLSDDEDLDGNSARGVFDSSDQLKDPKNQEGHSPQRVLVCDTCDRTFTSVSNLNSHHETHFCEQTADALTHNCLYCHFVFFSPNVLKAHLREQHPESLYTHECKSCGRVFLQNETLNSHIEDVHMDKTLPCLCCDEVFSTQRARKRHLALNICSRSTKDEEHRCPTCHKTFSYNQSLRTHMKNVCSNLRSSNNGKKCPYCDDFLENSELFHSHVEDKHEDKLSSHICEICRKFFVQLRNHLKSVHSEESATCELCGKTLKNLRILQEHKKWVHSRNSLKHFQCRFCSYSDPRKFVVDKHENVVHKGIKTLVCNSCGKTFSQRGNLDKHVRAVHMQQKPNVCHYCGKHFTTGYQMSDHIKRVHMGMKYIRCPTCCRNYPSQDSLNKHLLQGCDGKKRKSKAKGSRKDTAMNESLPAETVTSQAIVVAMSID